MVEEINTFNLITQCIPVLKITWYICRFIYFMYQFKRQFSEKNQSECTVVIRVLQKVGKVDRVDKRLDSIRQMFYVHFEITN